MSPTPNSGAGFVLCVRCGQRLAAGTVRCLYCGAPQDAPVVAHAGAAVPGFAGSGAPMPADPHALGGPGRPPLPGPGNGMPLATEPAASVFGDAFAGKPATTGRRLLALTIDIVAVLIVVGIVGVATGSFVLAAVVLAELWIGLWVAQARTGLGLGTALLRIRVARADAPYSPGLGRAFVRTVITTAGALVFFVGAWIVEASSAWDASPKRRAWSDRAAGTVVVAVPARGAARPVSVAIAPPVVQRAPSRVAELASGRWTPPPPVQPAVPEPVVRQPAVHPAPVRQPTVEPPVQKPLVSASSPASTPAPVRVSAPPPSPAPPAPAAPMTRGQLRRETRPPIASVPNVPSDPVPTEPADDGALLLILDTGERAQVPAGVSVVLGRKPASDTDLVVTVADSTVSKNHARLEHRATGVWVTDLGSTNGTDLLDESGRAIAIPARVATRVEEGMRVRIGDRVFTVSRLIGSGA
ncbi:hypothetical protein LK09_13185 [Microbacterium mangrovi]|uniref:FHA domain-containing protein n=1 Tax=Microbacterium mangrovi TaxID=1348253 RepID=A0A0B2A6N1_9MICO|nr:FHA domain-containing protein [Microbacterium mangrovi]KHK97203.1 hypothetical protein LK09_13185 [Microbacterium mangrovi]